MSLTPNRLMKSKSQSQTYTSARYTLEHHQGLQLDFPEKK